MAKAASPVQIRRWLGELSGSDYAGAADDLADVRSEYRRLDRAAQSAFSAVSAGGGGPRFPQNAPAFTSREPAGRSAFIYFDISSSGEVLDYVVRVRNEVARSLGAPQSADVRFSGPGVQHVTAFSGLVGTDGRAGRSLVRRVKEAYQAEIRRMRAFGILILGPHLLATGGVVLEGAVYSPSFYGLRGFALRAGACVKDATAPRVPGIIHSTVAYVVDGDPRKLDLLRKRLGKMRAEPAGILVRIREARISATLNSRLVGKAARVPLAGLPPSRPTDAKAQRLLSRLLGAARAWRRSPLLKSQVREEAFYWAEAATTAGIERLACGILGV